MTRLLGLGDNTVDIYLTDGMQYPGGNAVNVAVQAARCGAAASYLGCLGRDRLGDLVHDSLAAEGVDLSHVRRIDGPNPWSRIRHENNDRKFAGSNPGVRSGYRLAAADDAFIAAHDVVHISVHSDLDAEIARIAAHSRLLSYDYSEHWERPSVTGIMSHVDVAFLSAPGRSRHDCGALLESCAGRGPRVVVVTRGAEGACAWAEGEIHEQAIQPVEVVDTLGAGDGLIAAFLVAYAGGAALPECLQQGVAHAARVCATKGGFGHGVPIRPGQPGLDPSQIVNRPREASRPSLCQETRP